GTPAVVGLAPVGGGGDVIFDAGGGVICRPDGVNMGGGGKTARRYAGTDKLVQILAMDTGTAVVTLFADGSAYYSPDNQSLGGGGQTVPATADNTVKRMVKVGGGVLAQFASGNIYLSPDGMNLAGGGHTI